MGVLSGALFFVLNLFTNPRKIGSLLNVLIGNIIKSIEVFADGFYFGGKKPVGPYKVAVFKGLV